MTRVPIGCELWIDGARVADGAWGASTMPNALDNLTVSWGRSTLIDQPEPATCTVDLLDQGDGTTRAEDVVGLGSLLIVYATLDGADRRVVFAGRVTDVETDWDTSPNGAVTSIVAADLLADLASRYVGDDPWPMETVTARASRILAAAGSGTIRIDARPAGLAVSRVDVDRQPAAGLLTDLATSGSGVLWVITPTGATTPQLWIEDPYARPSLWVLGKGADGLWRPMQATDVGDPIDSSALARDPVKWTRSTADLITRATIRWLDQSTEPDTTERTVMLVDDEAEAEFGARGLSVGTILASEDAARAAAQLLLVAHQSSDAWRAEGFEWDTDDTVTDDAGTRALLLDLLDNATRIGRTVQVGGLPWWTPAAGAPGRHVEGGTYRYTGGRWVLQLTTTSAAGSGGSITYIQTPRAIRYQDIARDVSFLDLVGVSAPSNVPEPIVRTNRAVNPRPVGTGADGWVTTRGFGTGGAGTHSFVTSPTGPFGGSFGVRRKSWTSAATSIGNNGFQINQTASESIPVTPGETLTVSGYVRFIGAQPAAPRTFVMRVNFWDRVPLSGAVQVGGTPNGPPVATSTLNGWVRVSVTATVPAGAAGMRVFLDTAQVAGNAPMAAGDGLDGAALQIEAGDTATSYLDGSLPATVDTVYAWTGAVNASASTATTIPASADPVGDPVPAAPAPATVSDEHGFPVPVDTDAFCDVPAYLADLAAAVEPRLQNLPMQFVPATQRALNANGEATVNLSAQLSAVAGVLLNAEATAPYAGNIMQAVTVATDAAGVVRIRALTVPPPDGTVSASGNPLVSMIVWGTAR